MCTLFQQEGESIVKLNGQEMAFKSDDSLLIPAGVEYQLIRNSDSCFLMSVAMSTPNETI
jgi:mannose-6-phosphate isomerase-like protein (cupin superfamily)